MDGLVAAAADLGLGLRFLGQLGSALAPGTKGSGPLRRSMPQLRLPPSLLEALRPLAPAVFAPRATPPAPRFLLAGPMLGPQSHAVCRLCTPPLAAAPALAWGPQPCPVPSGAWGAPLRSLSAAASAAQGLSSREREDARKQLKGLKSLRTTRQGPAPAHLSPTRRPSAAQALEGGASSSIAPSLRSSEEQGWVEAQQGWAKEGPGVAAAALPGDDEARPFQVHAAVARLVASAAGHAESGAEGSAAAEGTPGPGAPQSPFGVLGLSPALEAAVAEMGIEAPTDIQALSVPAILRGQDVGLASHTGSGKTLAYLLPLVQLLKEDEVRHGRMTRPKRPRALVLCPTRELAEQVLAVAKALSHHSKFRAALVSGGSSLAAQAKQLAAGPIDVLIATPGRLVQLAAESSVSYTHVKFLVLDEADTMFDRGFGPELGRIVAPLRRRSATPEEQRRPSQQAQGEGATSFQTVLVTATISKAVQRLLEEEFPGLVHVRTDSLHKGVPNASHRFMRVSGAEDKLTALRQVLEPLVRRRQRVMVFCNTINSCRAVDHYLGENDLVTANYHGDIPPRERAENILRFKEAGALRSAARGLPSGSAGAAAREATRGAAALAQAADALSEDLYSTDDEALGEGADAEAGEEAEEWDEPEGEEWVADEVPQEAEEEAPKWEDGDWDPPQLSASSARDPPGVSPSVLGAAAGPQPLLVCTDLAARGLDLDVDHVICFDFPSNPVDYLHRTGRTARMGARGSITSLVTKRDELLARQVEVALQRGLSLENLSGDRAKVEAQGRRDVAQRRELREKQERKQARNAAKRGGAPARGPGQSGLGLGAPRRPRPGAGVGPTSTRAGPGAGDSGSSRRAGSAGQAASRGRVAAPGARGLGRAAARAGGGAGAGAGGGAGAGAGGRGGAGGRPAVRGGGSRRASSGGVAGRRSAGSRSR